MIKSIANLTVRARFMIWGTSIPMIKLASTSLQPWPQLQKWQSLPLVKNRMTMLGNICMRCDLGVHCDKNL